MWRKSRQWSGVRASWFGVRKQVHVGVENITHENGWLRFTG
ncbi:MAG: hypothetical protein OJF49_000666 [Ktedonobacterales bacterium]|nr:MAG: hypothetical protein OJF49_000666 [Ktedonobacterales bacterium]